VKGRDGLLDCNAYCKADQPKLDVSMKQDIFLAAFKALKEVHQAKPS
jgi:hypothetical protein